MNVSPPKAINLEQLQRELAASGIRVPALGATGVPAKEVHTYDATGSIVDLPQGAVRVIDAHVAGPDAGAIQRAQDAATLLNAPAVRDSQAHRDAFARLIGVQPLPIPLTQDATASDIHPF